MQHNVKPHPSIKESVSSAFDDIFLDDEYQKKIKRQRRKENAIMITLSAFIGYGMVSFVQDCYIWIFGG